MFPSPSKTRKLSDEELNVKDISVSTTIPRSGEEKLTVDKFAQLLQEKFGVAEAVARKIRQKTDNSSFDLNSITDDFLMECGISEKSTRSVILYIKRQLKPTLILKIFNDPIHGHMEMHPVCVAVIDTKQFQRLRFIKQMGVLSFVYPGGSHNRFEHSLGTCHLAGKFTRRLQLKQPDLGITEEDVLCVELAGLCHDLGHGPFSHTYDETALPLLLEENNWKHEKASIDMFDYMVEQNGFMKDDGIFRKYGLTENDMTFIKEMIRPLEASDDFKARTNDQYFFYELISNATSGIDVDKWDYFSRDSYHLNIRNKFDHDRIIKFSKVLKVNEKMRICYRDKEIPDLYDMFYTRYTLHRRAKDHPVNFALELMVSRALEKADKHLGIMGKNNERKRISECPSDMEAYCNLTDHVLHQILYFEKCSFHDENESEECNKDMDQAKELIERIFKRKLFKCIGQIRKSSKVALETDKIKAEVLSYCTKRLPDNCLFIKEVKLDFGKKEKDPIADVYCYSKADPDNAKRIDESSIGIIFKPREFCEKLIRAYCCSTDQSDHEQLKEAFQKWSTPDQPAK